MAKVTFKEHKQNQLLLLPPDISSMIPDNHVVRIVDKIIDEIDISPLFETYKGGGTSSYSPRMMLKVITYAYIAGIYTNRLIEKALRENVFFMWISGMSTPDHGTIHNFKSKRLKKAVDNVFASVIEVLIKSGYVKAENIFVDGTKIEANAGRYTYVWKKNVERHDTVIREKVKKLLIHVDELQKKEDAEYGDHNLEELEGNISAEQIEKLIDDINQQLSGKPVSKEIKAGITKLKRDYVPKLKKYENQKGMLKNRNSCSKTDPDATFFRLKEDHLGTSQLKPAYNIQIATENQYILGYGVYQKAADTSVLIPFLERVKTQLKAIPQNIIADAGYGSEENYDYIAANNLGNYVKYNMFDSESKGEYQKKIFLSDHFEYDKENDQYKCPSGQTLDFYGIKKLQTDNGYKSERRVYKSRSCLQCPFRDSCVKGEKDRKIEVSQNLLNFKNTVRQNLMSEKGIKLRKQRGVDVESVFGQIKHNHQFRRFYSRGIKNVNIEWGLLSIAHNLRKMAN